MKCIKCGTELNRILNVKSPLGFTIGYECINKECSEFGHPWTKEEHKDNQDWAVRHIRLLEQKVTDLESKITELTLLLKDLIK